MKVKLQPTTLAEPLGAQPGSIRQYSPFSFQNPPRQVRRDAKPRRTLAPVRLKAGLTATVDARVAGIDLDLSGLQTRNNPRLHSSTRVPVTPQNWAYLRAARGAELAAWKASLGEPAETAVAATQSDPLHHLVSELAGQYRKESRLVLALAGLAAAAVTYGLWNSVELVSHWTGFVQLIQRWVG